MFWIDQMGGRSVNYVKVTGLVIGLGALSACSTDEPAFGQLYRTVGSQIDTGGFGASIQNNTLVQTNPENYTISLARRFASEVPPTVNFEFDSARTAFRPARRPSGVPGAGGRSGRSRAS